MLGVPLFLADAPAGRWLGRHSVWGEEGILSPAPPRLVRPCFTVVADSSVKQGAFRIRRDRARPTGDAQPPSSPLSGVYGVAFATGDWWLRRATALTPSSWTPQRKCPRQKSPTRLHVLAHEARVSTRRASSHPMRAQTPAVRHTRGTGGGSLVKSQPVTAQIHHMSRSS